MQAGLVRASQLTSTHGQNEARAVCELFLTADRPPFRGEIVQISGDAVLSTAVGFTRTFLSSSEAPVAWIASDASIPFPVDLATAEVDLRRVLFIRTAKLDDRLRAVDRLVRAEVCSLIVIDLAGDEAPDAGMLGRFMHLCERNGGAIVLLTPGEVGAVSPAVRIHLRAWSLAPHGDIEVEVYRTRSPLQGGVVHGHFVPGLC